MSTTKEAEFQPVASESAAGAQPSMDAVPLAESTPAEPTILAEKTNASATEQTPIAKKEPAINPHQKADPQAQTAKANKQRATKIAEAEAELNEARKATVTYKDARKASGKNLKGGPIKRIWNAKERLWILKRQQAFPDRTILEQARIVGVKTPDGKMRPVSRISKTGRTHDFAEVRGTKVVGGDLKSTEEFLTSIEGGVKKAQTMEGEFRKSSKIGGQHKVEDKVRKAAIKSGGVIVMQGKNVLTGKIETIEVPAANYRSEVLTYEDVRPN
jgi:hypothetical protein